MKFKGSKVFRIILVFILVVCGIGVSAGTYLYSSLGTMTIQAEENPETTAEAVEVPITEPINILLLGTDFGAAGATNENEKRTDTIMVAHYEPKLKKMFVVSIPRDTKVKINGKYTKINDANILGGTKFAVETVEDLLDIRINYYVEVNYQGFNKIIDAIGGITLTVPQTMIYDDDSQNLHINFKKGETVELDGKRAEEFFRWRKNNDGIKSDGDGSDLGRIENQRVLLKAIIDKVSSFNSITKLPALVNTATSYVTTNMTANDIVKYGIPFAKLGNSNIEFATIKGSTPPYKPGELSYFVYEPSMNKEILAALNGDIYLNKEELKIDVVNATGEQGVATKYRNRLVNKYNYISSNIEMDLLDTPVETTKLVVYGLDKKYEELLKKEFGLDKIEFSSENKGKFDMILTVGKDYLQNNK